MDSGQTDAKRLTEACLALPYRERVLLEARLREANIAERIRPRPRPRRVEALAEVISGVTGRPWNLKSRRTEDVWARTMVAYQLAKEGMPVGGIGKALGKNHATAIFMRRKMRDALDYPWAYRDIMSVWDKFQIKLKEYDIQRGTTEDAVGLGGELPHGGECSMGKESGQIRTQGDL